jgi:uncharacterized protein YkwD
MAKDEKQQRIEAVFSNIGLGNSKRINVPCPLPTSPVKTQGKRNLKMCLLLRKIKLRKRSRPLSIFLLLFFFPALSIAASEQEKQLFGYINSERARENRMPLIWDEDVYHVALAHSKDMARAEKASHRGTDGREPHERIRSAQIYASKSGENIARDVNVISAHTLLMQSVEHRENILEPGFSHAAVAIVREKQFLYITELFIYKIGDYSLDQARETLVRQYNYYRQDQKLPPLIFSTSLSNAAQAHVETQKRFDSLSPMLTMSSVARSSKGRILVTAYTATTLLEIPGPVRKDLQSGLQTVGIGFKRVQGSICGGGCYLIVLIFG